MKKNPIDSSKPELTKVKDRIIMINPKVFFSYFINNAFKLFKNRQNPTKPPFANN